MENIKERKSFKFIVVAFALMLGMVFTVPSLIDSANATSTEKIKNAVTIKSATYYVKKSKLLVKYKITRNVKKNEHTEVHVACPVTILEDSLKRTKGEYTYTRKIDISPKRHAWCDGFVYTKKGCSSWSTKNIKFVY